MNIVHKSLCGHRFSFLLANGLLGHRVSYVAPTPVGRIATISFCWLSSDVMVSAQLMKITLAQDS